MIAEGHLLPREHIRQDELADALAISKIPLREALHVLVGERVIQHVPGRGFFVSDLTISSLRQLYRMRDLLEPQILNAIRKPNNAIIEHIKSLNSELRRAHIAGDI